jgi:hypothetical protein
MANASHEDVRQIEMLTAGWTDVTEASSSIEANAVREAASFLARVQVLRVRQSSTVHSDCVVQTALFGHDVQQSVCGEDTMAKPILPCASVCFPIGICQRKSRC